MSLVNSAKNTLKITLFDTILISIMRLFPVRCIGERIMKVCLSVILLVLCVQFFEYLHLGKYHDYAAITCQIAASLQIILSGRRSLLLPSIALAFGLGMATHLGAKEAFWTMSQTFYGHMAVVGIIGLLYATLSMRTVSATALTQSETKVLSVIQ